MATTLPPRDPLVMRRLGAHFRTDIPQAEARAFGHRDRWLLVAGFALLVIFRLPHAWSQGRFLDEEATVFFAYAWHRPWLEALFRAFGGYLNFGANATTLLAVALVKGGIVPLERAPYLTMTAALAIQLLPAVLIVTGRARWLAARPAVVAALLIVALAPGCEEVFCNVLHIQFHLALGAALILALDPPRRRVVMAGYGALLVAAPLCGPGAIVILPLFALRALVDRDRRRLVQFGVFAAGAAVQLLLFYGSSPMRGHLFGPGTIAATMFVRMIALPLRGFNNANAIGRGVYQSQLVGGPGWWLAVVVTVALFGMLLVVAARRRDAAIWLVLSGLSIAVATFGFGMVILHAADLFSVGAGGRYNFLPLVLLGLALVVLATGAKGWERRVYGGICLVMLVTGAINYPRPMYDFSEGPSWAREVRLWRRDHHHPLAVWPEPWTADLSDDSRPCAPIGRDPSRSSDPRYCESGWVAGFYRWPGGLSPRLVPIAPAAPR